MKMEFTAQMIASLLGGDIVGDKDVVVSTISSIEQGQAGSLAYLTNLRYESFLYSSNASIVITNKGFEPSAPIIPTLILVDDASQAVVKLLEIYNEAINKRKVGVSSMASIHEGVELADELYIGEFTVVESGAKIGSGCQIYPQSYIGQGVTIGEGTTIHPGVKIYRDCHIGANCIIHSGAVIGADGFGFALKADGSFDKIPQLGNVIIEDNVEIGANTCIDRAKTDSTIIRSGVKLDNLIQVAHNVHIGENTVSSAQMGIAGSSRIGRNCFLGGKVGIVDHVTIGDNCKFASLTGVVQDVADGDVRAGFMSMPSMRYNRSVMIFRKLPELAQSVRVLEKELQALKSK